MPPAAAYVLKDKPRPHRRQRTDGGKRQNAPAHAGMLVRGSQGDQERSGRNCPRHLLDTAGRWVKISRLSVNVFGAIVKWDHTTMAWWDLGFKSPWLHCKSALTPLLWREGCFVFAIHPRRCLARRMRQPHGTASSSSAEIRESCRSPAAARQHCAAQQQHE